MTCSFLADDEFSDSDVVNAPTFIAIPCSLISLINSFGGFRDIFINVASSNFPKSRSICSATRRRSLQAVNTTFNCVTFDLLSCRVSSKSSSISCCFFSNCSIDFLAIRSCPSVWSNFFFSGPTFIGDDDSSSSLSLDGGFFDLFGDGKLLNDV